jgi:uncharacterized phage protein (TIGR02220 family)
MDLKIFLIIHSFKNYGEHNFSPNYLHKVTGHSDSTIKISLKRLLKLEFITKTFEGDPKNREPARYISNVTTLANLRKDSDGTLLSPVIEDDVKTAHPLGENRRGGGANIAGGTGANIAYKELNTKTNKSKKKNSGHCKKQMPTYPPLVILILNYLMEKADKPDKWKPNKTNCENINARVNDGYTEEQLRNVIDWKCQEWKEWAPDNLNPITLFRPKNFIRYLNDGPPTKKKTGGVDYDNWTPTEETV